MILAVFCLKFANIELSVAKYVFFKVRPQCIMGKNRNCLNYNKKIEKDNFYYPDPLSIAK